MEWIKQLQRAVDYIEAHLLEGINYEDAAKSVYMSSYSFHRTFSLMAGMTANEYIRKRRLSLAARELQTTDISVIDAALKYGYESPESFSKAFSRFHGVTPRQAKEKGAPLRMFAPLAIKVTLEGGYVMDYKITSKGRQRLIALVREFPNEIINDPKDHSISDFWDECHEKSLIEPIRNLRPEGKRDLYGLCSPKKGGISSFEYGIGIILDADTDVSDENSLIEQGYRLWETQPSEYAVIKCEGSDGDCIEQAWNRFFTEFLPRSGYMQSESDDYEIYYERGEKGVFCELWIPIIKEEQ